MKLFCSLLFFTCIPFISGSQVLLQLHDDARQVQLATLYKKHRIKTVSYTYEMPSLFNMTFSSEAGNTTGELTMDTITHVEQYLENGLIANKRETLPNGDIRYSKVYTFDDEMKLIRTTEINYQPVRFYDYQQMTYHYSDRILTSIDKMRFEAQDTTRSTTVFTYEAGVPVKVIETDNRSGDTLLSAFFTRYPKKKYIEEQYFVKDFSEMRTVYYYDLDRKGRIVKVSHGLEGYRKDLEADREIFYNLSKELPKDDGGVVKIERY